MSDDIIIKETPPEVTEAVLAKYYGETAAKQIVAGTGFYGTITTGGKTIGIVKKPPAGVTTYADEMGNISVFDESQKVSAEQQAEYDKLAAELLEQIDAGKFEKTEIIPSEESGLPEFYSPPPVTTTQQTVSFLGTTPTRSSPDMITTRIPEPTTKAYPFAETEATRRTIIFPELEALLGIQREEEEATREFQRNFEAKIEDIFISKAPKAPPSAKFLKEVVVGVGSPFSFFIEPIRTESIEAFSKTPVRSTFKLAAQSLAFPLIAGFETAQSFREGDIGTGLGKMATTATYIGAASAVEKGLNIIAGKVKARIKPEEEFFIPTTFETEETNIFRVTTLDKTAPAVIERTISFDIQKAKSVIPIKEFKTKIKTGEIEGLFVRKPAVSGITQKNLGYVEVPVIRAGKQTVRVGPGIAEFEVASFEKALAATASRKQVEEFLKSFKGRETTIKPFGEPAKVKPVSPAAQARANLFMRTVGRPKGSKGVKPLERIRIDTKNLIEPISLGYIEEPLFTGASSQALTTLFGGSLSGRPQLTGEPITVSMQEQKTFQGTLNFNLQKELEKQQQKQSEVQRSIEKKFQIELERTTQTQIPKETNIFKQVLLQKQPQRQEQKQSQSLALDFKPPIEEARITRPRSLGIPKYLPSLRREIPKRRVIPPSKRPAYDVFVKENQYSKRGVKVNKQKLDRLSALSLGARITDQTPAASFKIKRISGFAENKMTDETFNALRRKFRPSRKDMTSFVEKEKYRIDSVGEIMGIPLKRRRK